MIEFWPEVGKSSCVCAKLLQSCLTLATLWMVALQAPLFMGLSRQVYWSGLPCPPPGDFPNPGIKPTSLMSPALTTGFFTTSATGVKVIEAISWPGPGKILHI